MNDPRKDFKRDYPKLRVIFPHRTRAKLRELYDDNEYEATQLVLTAHKLRDKIYEATEPMIRREKLEKRMRERN